jgi:hypothetical protein
LIFAVKDIRNDLLLVAQPLTGQNSRCQGFELNPDSGYFALSAVVL